MPQAGDCFAPVVQVDLHMSTPSSPVVNDPEYWQHRAQEARALAEHLDDPVAKQAVLEIAAGYEQVAAFASARLLAGEPE